MVPASTARLFVLIGLTILLLVPLSPANCPASDAAAKKNAGKKKGPPPAPVRVATVVQKTVSDQLSLIGTAEAFATSTVAAEVPGMVVEFPVKAGDFVEKGQLLVHLKDTEMRLRLRSHIAERERVQANLENAEKELDRIRKLREAGSIAETKYDDALYAHRALSKVLMKSQAAIDHLEYQIRQNRVFSPFAGFVVKEHTQIGQWMTTGGPVATLMDMRHVLITVDVPERFAVKISRDKPVRVLVRSVQESPLSGEIYTILHQGNANARTIPVRVRVPNPDYAIRAGMEAQVAFSLADIRDALLVPKDAVVTAGDNRMVYAAIDGRAVPFGVRIAGYYGGDVAVEGDLKPGMLVVVRGNERLRPGQAVAVTE